MPQVLARNPTGRQDADTVLVVANGETDEIDKTRHGDISINTSPALLNISGGRRVCLVAHSECSLNVRDKVSAPGDCDHLFQLIATGRS
ncbi:MAG: hypothetical protein PSV22_13250, partial [Pseudolabrys sp.]|nr:hypothetical protein [Pseudolabrys sp.]